MFTYKTRQDKTFTYKTRPRRKGNRESIFGSMVGSGNSRCVLNMGDAKIKQVQKVIGKYFNR